MANDYSDRRRMGGDDEAGDRLGAAEVAAENIAWRKRSKRRVCKFCVEKVATIDYKDVNLLRYFLSDRGKIVPPRVTGACAKHQRMIRTAIARGRMIALVPFTTTGS